MHLRIAQEQIDAALEQALADDVARARASHVETGGDTSLVADLSIRSGDGTEQPPAVLAVMGAAHRVAQGWAPSDAELSRSIVDDLDALHATDADLEALIDEGVVEDWARGYWRALQTA
jgi:hypothetical protein